MVTNYHNNNNNGPLSGTTRVSWYQKKHTPAHVRLPWGETCHLLAFMVQGENNRQAHQQSSWTPSHPVTHSIYPTIFTRVPFLPQPSQFILAWDRHEVCWVVYLVAWFTFASVLWRCWLGSRKGIQPVKNWVVGYWHGYVSGSECRFVYGPADATATHYLLLQ